jgi:hypothetical protein
LATPRFVYFTKLPMRSSMFQGFVQLLQQRNESATRCSQAFYRRLTGTADLSQLILGYLVTREWLVWYRSLAGRVVGGCALGSAGEVDCLTGHSLTISGGSCPRLRCRHSIVRGPPISPCWTSHRSRRRSTSGCDRLPSAWPSPVRAFHSHPAADALQ